jgi:hypothetical protein
VTIHGQEDYYCLDQEPGPGGRLACQTCGNIIRGCQRVTAGGVPDYRGDHCGRCAQKTNGGTDHAAQ